MKNATFWDMMTPFVSCKNDVSEEFITSIFQGENNLIPLGLQ
jgi:hypothetical protein